MRTHRIKMTCNCEECAKMIEENVLHYDFCDMTHWHCVFDGAGEDTPDTCIIYRGIVEPNVIYVDFHVPEGMDSSCEFWIRKYDSMKETLEDIHPGWKILKIELNELASYKLIKKLRSDVAELKRKIM